jgi:peptide-methionine (R)-S-oxide reductase
LNKNNSTGIFVCSACKTPLYASKHKFDSGTGWPSFDRAIKDNVFLDTDYKIGYARTELKCNTCGGHLGHSFNDGPKKTTGIRHCTNGVALTFVPSGE